VQPGLRGRTVQPGHVPAHDRTSRAAAASRAERARTEYSHPPSLHLGPLDLTAAHREQPVTVLSDVQYEPAASQQIPRADEQPREVHDS